MRRSSPVIELQPVDSLDVEPHVVSHHSELDLLVFPVSTYPRYTMHSDNDTTAQHDAIREAMGGLTVCPIDLGIPEIRILDSGTGDGRSYQFLILCHNH